jgi:hypothetical protein
LIPVLAEVVTSVDLVVIGGIGIINHHILAGLVEGESEGVGGLEGLGLVVGYALDGQGGSHQLA